MAEQVHDSDLIRCVERLITDVTGTRSTAIGSQPVSGGCINAAHRFELENGDQYFVKSNQGVANLFEAESAGLEAIRATATIRVPEVVGLGETESGTQFLVLEFVSSARVSEDFFESFGRQLAHLHRAEIRNSRFGFPSDNFIGSTSQKNTWHNDWVEFFAVERLEFQLKLANHRGLATAELNRDCSQLILRLDQFISSESTEPALIHGDLWSGNYLASAAGLPVLVDPAAYYGARESEFGMTKLFGGFNSQFYHAYNEAYPLTDGWEQRVEIYKLYHLLNHLNLFGTSYLSECLQVLRKLR